MVNLFFALFIGITRAVYDYSELVPMSSYSQEYRTLSCWECFDVRGKMCHKNDYTSMMQVTGSSNFGHGICCKPESTHENCVSNGYQTCSQPVLL